MNIRKDFVCAFVAFAGWLLTAASVCAQDYKNWVRQALRMPDSFFLTSAADSVVSNVLASQLPTGGWGKNVNFFVQREEHPEDEMLGTIDNNATTTEIRFLLRYYQLNASSAGLTGEDLILLQDSVDKEVGTTLFRSKAFDSHNEIVCCSYVSALKGIEYILMMQYANGGFPQYYPRTDHYHAFITFNDNAMLNVLRLLDDVSHHRGDFSSLPEELAKRSGVAFRKGVDCILKCQIVKNGEPTVWCQQHDPVTLAPQHARAYELPSFVSAESVDIVQFLMSLPQPNDTIRRAVDGAMRWFDEHAIVGMQRKDFVDSLGRRDYRMVMSTQAETGDVSDANGLQSATSDLHKSQKKSSRLWARFYDLTTDRPFFCGRDGIPHERVEDIEYERRNGYAWFTNSPERLFLMYKQFF